MAVGYEKALAGKTLLITGGTGSFGNAVFSQLREYDLTEIRVFSRDEKKQHDMRLAVNDPRAKFIIGDVRDFDSVRDASVGADFIFHAAALKQVPSCEFYPMEAVKTNVMGTDNVLRAAEANKVSRAVVLSTDKAVYPINAMGISKAMMEKVMVARSRTAAQSGLTFCATRYGNVMGSRGSVIPLFAEQIANGKQMTVTDPEMTRFLMSLEESVDLVLHAFTHSEPGDIFVRKAPASTIGTLVAAMQKMAGVESELKIIGTRHGEKLFESLLSREEMAVAEDMGDFYRVRADNRDLNYANYFSEGADFSDLDDYTSHNTTRLNEDEVIALLKRAKVYS